ncbi:MAG: DUF2306 domain-containing protein [Betaproteobacteria bacterium]|nr:DUF2306 domain-containing protein [Betaproteobacteria bacterium]
MNDTAPRQRWTYIWLAAIFVLSVYYLYRAINYRYFTPAQQGPDFVAKQFWYYSHLLFALPVLFGAPLQFIAELRQRAPHIHRAVGKAYVIGACVAALTAIYLGGTGQYEGSRLSIVLTGLLWLFFTLAAWRQAVAKNYATHRAFMIRSYTLALVLVWLRLMYDLQDYLFFYVENADLRDATREWASWVLPLLVVEFWISWRPQLGARKRAA